MRLETVDVWQKSPAFWLPTLFLGEQHITLVPAEELAFPTYNPVGRLNKVSYCSLAKRVTQAGPLRFPFHGISFFFF